MKKISNELDVDFIGGQGPLIKEELAISEYIEAQKLLKTKKQFRRKEDCNK